jgi:hypothetical protein
MASASTRCSALRTRGNRHAPSPRTTPFKLLHGLPNPAAPSSAAHTPHLVGPTRERFFHRRPHMQRRPEKFWDRAKAPADKNCSRKITVAFQGSLVECHHSPATVVVETRSPATSAEKPPSVDRRAMTAHDFGPRINHTARILFSDAARWYRDTGTIAFRTRLCSISAHAEAPPNLRAQQQSGMIALGSVGL